MAKRGFTIYAVPFDEDDWRLIWTLLSEKARWFAASRGTRRNYGRFSSDQLDRTLSRVASLAREAFPATKEEIDHGRS